MVSAIQFKQLALSLPAVTEQPHFDKTSFRIKKKIFATLNEKEHRATIKLNETEQDLFCLYDKDVMYPVPNKWGKQGWTHINLKTIPKEMCREALQAAFEIVSGIR